MIVVPYTRIRDETRAALDASGRQWEGRDVGGSDTAYFDLLRELWRLGRDLVIVEHDIVVGPETLDLFETCPSQWCANSYAYMHYPAYFGLGCTRFRGELMRALPTLLDRVGEREYPGHAKRHWCTLDSMIQHELWSTGRFVCEHPPVQHLSTWPSHGCHGPQPPEVSG